MCRSQYYYVSKKDDSAVIAALDQLSGYYGLICASHFGRMVPAITVQMMPL
ncbi:hypothetical protein J2X77_004890 [Sphingobacterium sp. 2149]|nr:hypothetical protein [Sphingobacterium sp. 2149]